MLDPEDEGITILWNVWIYLPNLYLLHYHAANFILLADDNRLTFIRFKFKYNRSVVVYSDAVQIFSRCFVFDVACLIVDKLFVINLSVCLYLCIISVSILWNALVFGCEHLFWKVIQLDFDPSINWDYYLMYISQN